MMRVVDFDALTDDAKGHWLDLANAAQLALSRRGDRRALLALSDALIALGLRCTPTPISAGTNEERERRAVDQRTPLDVSWL
jgi:hypothetical protein